MQYIMVITERLECDRRIVVDCPDKMHYSELMHITDNAISKAIHERSFDCVSDYLKSNGVTLTKDSKVDYEHPRLAVFEVLTGNAI